MILFFSTKETLAIRIGNDIEIALADIDLDRINNTCTKKYFEK